MMGDRVLVRPLKWEPSKLLEVVRHGRPVRGEIVAVGTGCFSKKYTKNHDGQKTGFKYSKHFRPTEVKVGDIVELGGIDVFDGRGYAFTEVIVGNETMLICQEQDVCGIVEKQ